jgi:hypothetical protein
MDDAGQRIRELKGVTGPLHFDRQTSNELAEYQASCKYRNLRGKCANPNVLDENGQMMAWEDFDAATAKGINPRDVWKSSPQHPSRSGGFMQ